LLFLVVLLLLKELSLLQEDMSLYFAHLNLVTLFKDMCAYQVTFKMMMWLSVILMY
jgi:hypothetical protein